MVPRLDQWLILNHHLSLPKLDMKLWWKLNNCFFTKIKIWLLLFLSFEISFYLRVMDWSEHNIHHLKLPRLSRKRCLFWCELCGYGPHIDRFYDLSCIDVWVEQLRQQAGWTLPWVRRRSLSPLYCPVQTTWSLITVSGEEGGVTLSLQY